VWSLPIPSPPIGESVVAMLISNREDIDVSLSEVLTGHRVREHLLGSAARVELSKVTAGNDATGQALRIKADGGLINGLSDGGVNVQGKDIVLEGGDGTVGSQAAT